MPFKHHAARRHRIGKMKFKVANWADYEAGLRRRGSLTLWMTAETMSSWQAAKRTTRGGQPRYSDLAIETALTVGLVFGLRLRQTEGLLTHRCLRGWDWVSLCLITPPSAGEHGPGNH